MTTKRTALLTISMSTLAAIVAIGAAPTSVQAQETIHTVNQGEYLYNIAPQYNVTVDELIEWNQLDSIDLQIGDQLVIHTSDSTISDETTENTEEAPTQETTPTDNETNNDLIPMTDNGDYYVVKSGDYLYKIANRFGISVDALMEANHLNNYNLQIGDVLVIPNGDNNSGGEEDDNGNEEQPTEGYYTVVAGDYLYKIANKFGTTVEAIKEANDLTNNNLQIGDVLIIPGADDEDDDNGNEEQPTEKYYTVVAGDYLYKIANKFGITVEAIKEANDLTNNNLQIGDVLIIPNSDDSDDEDDDNGNEEQPTEKYYTVVAGDYLYKIANKFGITVEAIKEANDLTNNNLQIGDVLIIPNSDDSGEEDDDNGNEEQLTERYYTVVAGDYLYKIANKFGTTIEAIKEANELTSNSLSVGDVLIIPTTNDEEEDTPEFIAPKPGDTAYMSGMTLIKKAFPTVKSALDYAEEHFDYTRHENYFVNYHKGSYVLYFQTK